MAESTHRRGRPPESASRDTRQRILRAATRLFSEQGFHGTSVVEIGQAADIQTGALYYHIKSKDELLWMILHDYLASMRSSTLEIAAAIADPLERLRALLNNHIDKVITHRRELMIEVRDRSALSRQHRDQYNDVRFAIQGAWQQTLDDGYQLRLFRSADRIVTNSILTMANGASSWYRSWGNYSIAEISESITELVLGGVLTNPQVNR